MPRKERSWQKIEYVIFGMLSAVLACLTLYLTYQQAWYAWRGITDTGYHSDVLAYMQEAVGIETKYSFPYPVMFWLIRLLHLILPVEWSVAAVITGLQLCSFVLLRFSLKKYLQSHGICTDAWKQVLPVAAAFSLMFYSMLFVYNHPLPGLKFYYIGAFSPNPFHNATYVAARPFSIVCVFLFAQLLDIYEKKPDWKKAFFFGIVLLLATMTKPSFTIVFCAAAGLIMLYRLIRSRFRNFKNTFLLGCMFLPTFADLLYQFGGVFTGLDSEGQETGIGVALFRVWREYCSNYIVAIAAVIFFPVVVLCFQYRKLLTNTLYRFGWQIYGMGLAMFILLYEKGFRAVDANFSWGYMIGSFFLVMSSLLVLLEETLTEKKFKLKLLIQWGAFILHVCCGLFYFIIIFTGGSYY